MRTYTVFELGFKLYGITMFLSGVLLGLITVMVGDVFDLLESIFFYFCSNFVGLPLLVLLTILLRTAVRIPYSFKASAIWLSWWMSVAMSALYIFFSTQFGLDTKVSAAGMAGITIASFLFVFYRHRGAFIALREAHSIKNKTLSI